jgi:hypothetical protein
MGSSASEIPERRDPKDVNVAFKSALNKDHATEIAAIVQTRENIEALIDAGASDKCVKPTTAENPIPSSLH